VSARRLTLLWQSVAETARKPEAWETCRGSFRVSCRVDRSWSGPLSRAASALDPRARCSQSIRFALHTRVSREDFFSQNRVESGNRESCVGINGPISFSGVLPAGVPPVSRCESWYDKELCPRLDQGLRADQRGSRLLEETVSRRAPAFRQLFPHRRFQRPTAQSASKDCRSPAGERLAFSQRVSRASHGSTNDRAPRRRAGVNFPSPSCVLSRDSGVVSLVSASAGI